MVEISSLETALNVAGSIALKEERGQWIFRGSANAEKFKLRPLVGREKYTSKEFHQYENSIMTIFKREVPNFLSIVPDNEWEWLALAQHHGLPTRMLDFSFNIMTALYFSVDSHEDVAGELIMVKAPKKASDGLQKTSPYNIKKLQKYFPRIVSKRITAQEGLFVVFPEPQKLLDEQLRSDWSVKKFTIPAEKKKRIRYELFRCGVHRSSLFPDLEGLCDRIRWSHTVNPITAGIRSR